MTKDEAMSLAAFVIAAFLECDYEALEQYDEETLDEALEALEQ